MHPDQSTPDTHRYHAADSHAEPPHQPEQDQDSDAVDEVTATESDEPGSAPEVGEGARVAEAGHAYTGRQMDDELKSSPRVDEPGAGVDDES